MKIEEKSNYSLITPEATAFDAFFSDFKGTYLQLVGQHLVLELSENLNITPSEISLFLEYAVQSKTNGTSFVVVKSGINIDDFDENLNIVPTLAEAEDVIEMEAIERDLGF